MRHWLIAAALLTIPLAAPFGAAADQSGISVTDAWSRPAMAGRSGIVYLTVTDTGAPDRLIGVSTPVAAKADLHESIDDHGIMKMRSVAALPVEAGKTLTLSPNGYHIMLTGLKQPLTAGETFPVTLHFAKAGDVTTTAAVQKAGAGMAMDHGAMGGMSMPGGSPGSGMSGMPMNGGAAGAPTH